MLSKRPYLATLLLLGLGLVFGVTLVTGFGSWRGASLAFGASDPQLGGPLPSLPGDATLANLNGSFVAIAKAVSPTIVEVNVKTEAPKVSKNEHMLPFGHFFGFGDNGDDNGGGDIPFQMPQQGPEEGLGSGVIITSDGYIVTNNHVVKDAAKKGGVKVTLVDKRVFDAHVVGTDPTTDLAVIKIDATDLPVAALGNSDGLAVGQIVMAVGNPLNLESTVTQGIISSLGRSINIPEEGTRSRAGNYSISNFIQTDAAINPGNSGGGLFDIHGQVVGINAAIASPSGTWTGYGFAIPVNMVRSVAMDLIKNGKVNRGYIGVTIRAVDQTDAQALGLDRARGVRVDGVTEGGAGQAAGLRTNDVILSVDGHAVDEANQLQTLIGMHHAGDKVQLRIWRDGKEVEKSITLKPRPDLADKESPETNPEDAQGQEESANKSSATLDNIGVTVRNVTDQEKDKYHVSNGVIITSVAMASEAFDRGLGKNLVITEAARQKVKTASDFEKIINQNKGKAVGLMVSDPKGDTHFYAIQVPND
ncbi:MAG: trypsin-like peptidase domain-containing protein [Bacteroidota bacterium]|nr:trypsin-like peptidase domain-containing protein [Bacteroidota bacterium]MDP4232549.1 trypsin-like peptidase domain-containing protein [Bacteroidota bacterium]MDP4242996.1 trypsin-like peptidase domain-containing protein [Bacteroidota bacterium]MDP4286429.1 trypsin-like peptidase domain-containing protein [Bacteroidota bacterium]